MARGRDASDLKGLQVEFGNQIQTWLLRRNISQKALALSIQPPMDVSQLSKICNGDGNFELETIYRVIRGLGFRSLAEFYSVKEWTVMERRFEEEFRAFRQVLSEADEEGLNDLRKVLRRIPVEVRERASPGQPLKA